MKNLITLTLLILSISCTVTKDVFRESHLNNTLAYCGDFERLWHTTERRFILCSEVTYVATSLDTLAFAGYMDLPLCKGDRCYVKYFIENGGPRSEYYILYFTWEGADDFYMLRQNWVTGEVY